MIWIVKKIKKWEEKFLSSVETKFNSSFFAAWFWYQMFDLFAAKKGEKVKNSKEK